MMNALRRQEMIRTILVQTEKHNFKRMQAAGRVIHFGSEVDFVPGAVIQMHLTRGDDVTQIWVCVKTRTEDGEGQMYQAEHHQGAPRVALQAARHPALFPRRRRSIQ